MDELIHLMLELDRYAHHACVVGVGVDVEWYRRIDKPAQEPEKRRVVREVFAEKDQQ